jgi:hypothetical protein
METLIAEIVQKLSSLPEVKILKVLDFVDLLSVNQQHLTSPSLDSNLPENNLLQTDEEFEAIADRLADEFQAYIGASIPPMSSYAVSRAEIYQEHP